MKNIIGSVTKGPDRLIPPGRSFMAACMLAGLLASGNQALQAADFNPIADSYTDEAASSDNKATGTRLRVRSSTSGDGQIAFYKFDVSGLSGPVSDATLQLYSNSGSNEPVTAYAVSDNSWTENGITWSNQPTLGSALDTVNVVDGSYNNFDVSDLITGNGTYTIAVQGDTSVQQTFRSREHADLPILTVNTYSSEFSVVASPYPTDDVLVISESAADHGIVSDGSVDVTSDIQDLLDLVQSKGGGTAFLPEGTYRIDGNLIIPTGVWLRGAWEEPTPGQPINGTVLAIYGGRNSTSSIPVIHHLESSGSKDLVFWYPEQDPTNIVPYPPTVGGYRAIDGDYKGLQRAVGMTNLTFVNSYIAISAIAEDTSQSVGAHFNINNVYGTALYRGIQSGYISGNSKWTGIFFSPDYWADSGFAGSPTDSSHESWAKSNGVGIRISTKGQIYILHARISGFKWGVLQEVEGSDSSFYDCHFTNCKIGFEGTAYSTRAVNCVFEGSQYGLIWDHASSNRGEGIYHSSTFSGGNAAVRIPICVSQNFQACTFNDKVILEEGYFTAVDCDFDFSGTHVELARKADGAALIGNRYTGGFSLQDDSNSSCLKVDHTQLSFEPLPSFTYADYRTTVQDFKPAVAELFDAFAYGAAGDGVTDDTAAIQATIDAAAAAGGAIAFLPPAIYNVPGTLNVPSNVELRGSADGHHSANGDKYATVLLVTNDHGNANGTPFITLQANSGVRGMSFFYPNQDIPASEYPYLIRGAGENVYLWNLHAPNVARMCDFATNRCDNFYANSLYAGVLHNAYDISSGTTGGRIYMGMGKSFWGQLPAVIEQTFPATDVDVYTTEFLYHITAGDCNDLVVFGTYCRSNNTGIQTYDDGGAGPNDMLILNCGGEGTRVPYEVNKLSGSFSVVASGNKCGSSPENLPLQSQFRLDYSDPYTVGAFCNVMDTSGEMEVVVIDGDIELQGFRLDQQVARSGFWSDASGSLTVSAGYFPEVAAFAGDGTIEVYGNYMPLGAADSDSARLRSLWDTNLLGKGRGALAGTYENPYYYGLEILDTADSDYIASVDPFNENNWFSCTQPVLVNGQSKKKLYLDVVNPDLVNQSITGKIALGIHTTDTAGVVGDTMVHVYYDQNGQTLAGSFDAADPANSGKWKNFSFDMINASLNDGINGGDVLIEIGQDAVVSILYVEVRDNNDVCELPTNTAPVFAADPFSTSDATEDAAYSDTIAASAIDLDGDALTYLKVDGPNWLAVASDGSLSGTPTQSDVGGNSFTVSVSDGIAPAVEATMNITVANVNDTPVFASDPIAGSSATEDVAYSGSIAGSASDDDGDSLVYAKVSGPAWLSVATDGTLSGTPDNNAVGANAFTVSVSDGIAPAVQAALNISVANVNDAPAFTVDPIAGAGATEDVAYAGSIAGSASDEDGDSLTYAKVSGPAWLNVAADGTLSGTPNNSNVGASAFTVSVSDGIAPAVQAALNISVANVNDAPVFAVDPITGSDATEDAVYAGSIAGSASDDDGDSLTYAKVSGPAWLNVATDGTLSGTPDNSNVGANAFTVSVSDGIAPVVQAALNISVTNVNDAPVFTADPITGSDATEDVAYAGSIAGSASDEDGDSLAYAKVSGPAWLNVATDGTLSGTPDNSAVGANAFTVSVSDGIAPVVQATLNITVEATAGASIRVTEYYLTTGDFSGTSATVTLDQDLAADYYILIRGSRVGDGTSNPNNDYARVVSVPGGKGDLAASGANNQIGLQRQAAEHDWEGVVTVIECGNSASDAGFKLVDAVVTPMNTTTGTDISAAWSDINQVVLFGGYRGGGVEMFGTPGNRKQGTGCYTRLYPSGSNTLNWSRDAGGETMFDATMTTFVVEWGSEWTVQHVNVSGSNGGGGADATGEYTTAAISSVARDNTWVWGTGTRADSGIGDNAEACLVTLGDGVSQNTNETTVAVGSEYSDAYDFDVYVLTHSDLQVDHRFKVDGDVAVLDLPVAVDTASAGARFGWSYNGCNGTGAAFPRPRMWARYTDDNTITISRGYDGQNFPAWVQGVDFSGVND